MPIRSSSLPSLTGSQALYVLEQALRDRKLTPYDIERYRGSLDNEIRDIETRLSRLREATGDHLPTPRAAASSKASVRPQGRSAPTDDVTPARRRRRRPMRVTPEVLASRQLQGQYLGCISQIPPKKRPKYQRMAKEKGREKAIAAMKKALGK